MQLTRIYLTVLKVYITGIQYRVGYSKESIFLALKFEGCENSIF